MTKSGALIMNGFATIWWIVGVALSGLSSALLYGAAVLITGGIVVLAIRQHDPELSPEEHSRRGRLVGIASAAEGLVIFVVASVLGNIGRTDLTAAAIAVIVGLHFFPLAWKLPARLYFVTGAALLLLGVAGCFASQTHLRSWAVCLAAAAILWLTSASVLRYESER